MWYGGCGTVDVEMGYFSYCVKLFISYDFMGVGTVARQGKSERRL